MARVAGFDASTAATLAADQVLARGGHRGRVGVEAMEDSRRDRATRARRARLPAPTNGSHTTSSGRTPATRASAAAMVGCDDAGSARRRYAKRESSSARGHSSTKIRPPDLPDRSDTTTSHGASRGSFTSAGRTTATRPAHATRRGSASPCRGPLEPVADGTAREAAEDLPGRVARPGRARRHPRPRSLRSASLSGAESGRSRRGAHRLRGKWETEVKEGARAKELSDNDPARRDLDAPAPDRSGGGPFAEFLDQDFLEPGSHVEQHRKARRSGSVRRIDGSWRLSGPARARASFALRASAARTPDPEKLPASASSFRLPPIRRSSEAKS